MFFRFVCVKITITHSTDDHRHCLAPLCFKLVTPDSVLILEIVFNDCGHFFTVTQSVQANPSGLASLTAARVIAHLKSFYIQNFVVLFGVEKRFSQRQNVRGFGFWLLCRVNRFDLVALVDWLVNANDSSKSSQDKSNFSDQPGQSFHFVPTQLWLTVEKVRFNAFKAVKIVFANLNVVLEQSPSRLFNEARQQPQHILQ